MQRFERYGFISDRNKLEFRRVFGNAKFKEVYVDLYSNDPYVLLLRAEHKNVRTYIENGRLYANKKDGVSAMNVPLDMINDCMVMKHDDTRYSFIFTVFNLQYRMLIVV